MLCVLTITRIGCAYGSCTFLSSTTLLAPRIRLVLFDPRRFLHTENENAWKNTTWTCWFDWIAHPHRKFITKPFSRRLISFSTFVIIVPVRLELFFIICIVSYLVRKVSQEQQQGTCSVATNHCRSYRIWDLILSSHQFAPSLGQARHVDPIKVPTVTQKHTTRDNSQQRNKRFFCSSFFSMLTPGV